MGMKPRKPPPLSPSAEFSRVEEHAHTRIASAIRSGYMIRRNFWSIPVANSQNTSSKYGWCCAVGAIAFDGEQPQDWLDADADNSPEVYVMAAKQLKRLGVDPARFGGILDAISAGFEGEFWLHSAKTELAHDLAAAPFERYRELGKTLWELYGQGEL